MYLNMILAFCLVVILASTAFAEQMACNCFHAAYKQDLHNPRAFKMDSHAECEAYQRQAHPLVTCRFINLAD